MFLSKGRRVWISSDLLCSFVLIMLYHYYQHSSIESANNICEHFVFSALSHFAIHLYAKQELFTSGSRNRHQYNLFRFIVPILTNLITVINIVIAFFIAFFLHKHRFMCGCSKDKNQSFLPCSWERFAIVKNNVHISSHSRLCHILYNNIASYTTYCGYSSQSQ